MREVERARDARAHVRDLVRRERRPPGGLELLDHARERGPRHVLHRDEQRVVLEAEVERLHDRRVLERARDAGLVEEEADRLLRRAAGEDRLHGHVAREARGAGLLGEEDLGHAAGADAPDQPVRAQRCVRVHHRRGGPRERTPRPTLWERDVTTSRPP